MTSIMVFGLFGLVMMFCTAFCGAGAFADGRYRIGALCISSWAVSLVLYVKWMFS